ncbi:MAG TPA: hypothetical protein PK733_04835 [Clostridiales bacterium]|nr:hypothetical protein [Clostridiales bacterium]
MLINNKNRDKENGDNANISIKNKLLNRMIAFALIMAFAITILISGCNREEKGPSAQRQSGESEGESGKIPGELTEMEQGIEKIIKALNGPSAPETEKEESGKKGAEEEKQGSSDQTKKQDTEKEDGAKSEDKQSDQGKQQGQQGQEGQGKQQQTQQTETGAKKPQEKDPWQEVTPIINKMHFTWNSYMPEAVQKGASQEIINGFSSSLNGLTNSIISKNKNYTLISANNLYGNITGLFSLYKKQNVSEVKRLKYFTRNVVLSAMNSDWTQAETNINNLKSVWGFLKNMLGEENKKAASKLDFSITELEKVIKEKNQPLTDIKGVITLSNIEEVDKNLEKASSQSSGQGKEKSSK